MTQPPLDPLPSHLRVERSNRGFRRLPPLPSAYGGNVRAHESSAASEPHVWLHVTQPPDPSDPTGAAVEAVAHLTAADAWRLAEQLALLVRDHCQGDARPPNSVLVRLAATGAPPTAEEEPT